MMKIKELLYSIFLILMFFHGYSQKAKVASADKQYENFAYIDAITTYERVAEKGYKDEKMFQKLGNAYYFNAEFDKAAKWYGELFLMNENQEPEYLIDIRKRSSQLGITVKRIRCWIYLIKNQATIKGQNCLKSIEII